MIVATLFVGIPCAYNNVQNSNMNFFSSKPGNWYTSASTHEDVRIPIWQTILHSVCCIFLIIYIDILKGSFKKISYTFGNKCITPSRFTIWVKNLNSNYDPSELKTFYEEKGLGKGNSLEVECVSPVYDIGPFVHNARKLEQLKGILSYIEEYNIKYGRYPPDAFCSKTSYNKENLIETINVIQLWLNNFELYNKKAFSQADSAFVIFRKKSVAKKALQFWKRNILSRFLLFICFPIRFYCYSSQKFKGNILRAEIAPEPSDLIWENLSETKLSKCCRRLFTIFSTIILLVAFCFIIFMIKSYQYHTYNDLSTKKNMELILVIMICERLKA